MIIETGFRQTGKTTRMVKHALNHLLEKDNNIICLISNNLRSSKNIKKRIIDEFNKRYKCSDKSIKLLSRRINYSVSMNNGYEFSYYYINDFNFIKNNKILIKKNAYYNCISHEGLIHSLKQWGLWFISTDTSLSFFNNNDNNQKLLEKYSRKENIRKVKIHNLLKSTSLTIYDYIKLNEDKIVKDVDKSKLYHY